MNGSRRERANKRTNERATQNHGRRTDTAHTSTAFMTVPQQTPSLLNIGGGAGRAAVVHGAATTSSLLASRLFVSSTALAPTHLPNQC
eukprot:scaffold249353_cov82-Cyclotella_meneghiniana.AAC.7